MAKRKSKPKQSRAGARRARTSQSTKPKTEAKQGAAPRGQVGLQTYDQVRKIIEGKNLPVGEAFKEVAAATGRKPGTVAVTYYRIARQKRGPMRKRRGSMAAGASGGASASTRVAGALSKVSAAIKELEAVIASQAHEIARLKGASKLADRIRKALRE